MKHRRFATLALAISAICGSGCGGTPCFTQLGTSTPSSQAIGFYWPLEGHSITTFHETLEVADTLPTPPLYLDRLFLNFASLPQYDAQGVLLYTGFPDEQYSVALDGLKPNSYYNFQIRVDSSTSDTGPAEFPLNCTVDFTTPTYAGETLGGPPCTNGQAADYAIGQNDLNSGQVNQGGAGPTAGTLNVPEGVSYNSKTGLMVGDAQNNRALIYGTIPTASGASASVVVGQPDFTSAGSGSTAAMLFTPYSASSDGSSLYVADHDNNRVLIYTPVPTANGAAASLSLGSASPAVAGNPTCTSHSGTVFDVLPIGGDLIVGTGVDAKVFNPIPTSNNASATYAIGSSDNSCTGSIMSDGRVFGNGVNFAVADSNNNRVLIWNSLPPSFTTTPDVTISSWGSGPGSSLGIVMGVSIRASHLYVSDTSNNRVLIWNSIPTKNNQAPDVVLGQTTLTGSGSGTTATTLASPRGIATDDKYLYVVDAGNNRVLSYSCQ
jgi:hypothetical protein